MYFILIIFYYNILYIRYVIKDILYNDVMLYN